MSLFLSPLSVENKHHLCKKDPHCQQLLMSQLERWLHCWLCTSIDLSRHVRSSRKRWFRCPSVGAASHTVVSDAEGTMRQVCELQFSHSFKTKFPQCISSSLASSRTLLGQSLFSSCVQVQHRFLCRGPSLCLIDYLLQYLFGLSRCALGETVCNLVPFFDPPQICFAFHSS